MRFKDFKTGTKILTGFTLVMIIASIIGLIGLIGLRNVGTSFNAVSDVRMPSVMYLGEMEASLERVQRGYTLLLDPELTREERNQIVSEIEQNFAAYTHNNELFAPLEQSEQERRAYEELLNQVNHWRNINSKQVNQLHEEVLATDILNPMQINRDLEQFMKDHYELQAQTLFAIQNLNSFSGGEDPLRCNFGLWLPDFTTRNAEVNTNIDRMMNHHDNFHESVHRIKRFIEQGNQNAALQHYRDEMEPSAENVFNYFAVINREAQRALEAYREMSDIITKVSNPAHTELMTHFGELQAINVQEANNAVEQGQRTRLTSNSLMFSALAAGLLMAIVLGFIITRLITKGVVRNVEMVRKIAGGDLSVNLSEDLLQQKDETGQLAKSMQQMVEKLRDIIGGVVAGSDNIATASQQMSSTAQEMSQGSNEQASSAEEVSSSMEEMAANIEQNTDNSRETERIAIQAEKGILESNKASEQAVEAMKDIAQKITIIGEISRQTNILALNAAVEAARAGEHGKGFAVVAAEVRKLAERSNVAATEIDKLAKFGVSISEEAGEKLSAIVPEIQKTARLVQEIAAASIEQNTGADQVNGAIQQLNQVTQQNAAASEEMATSSEELASQADQLLEMVSYFKLENTSQFHYKKPLQERAPDIISKSYLQNGDKTDKTRRANNHSTGLQINLQETAEDAQYEKF